MVVKEAFFLRFQKMAFSIWAFAFFFSDLEIATLNFLVFLFFLEWTYLFFFHFFNGFVFFIFFRFSKTSFFFPSFFWYFFLFLWCISLFFGHFQKSVFSIGLFSRFPETLFFFLFFVCRIWKKPYYFLAFFWVSQKFTFLACFLLRFIFLRFDDRSLGMFFIFVGVFFWWFFLIFLAVSVCFVSLTGGFFFAFFWAFFFHFLFLFFYGVFFYISMRCT